MGTPSSTSITDGHHSSEDQPPQAPDHHHDPLSPPPEEKHSNIPQLTCAFLAALTTGGTSYAFGLYGAALKKSLDLSQPQLDTISTASFCAGVFSWIPGLIVDNFGVRCGLVSGGVLGAASLLAYWAVATQYYVLQYRWMLVPVLSGFNVLIFFSSALITGSVFKIIVSTCGPGSKGTAVGAAKGYVGLGVGVYASIFESLKTSVESDLDFLPMAAFFFVACVTIPSACLMPSHATVQSTDFADESTPWHFRTLFLSLGAMATLIVGQSVEELMEGANKEKSTGGTNLPMAILVVCIWVGPILGLQFLPQKSSLPPEEPVDLEEDVALLYEVSDDNTNPRESTGEISLQRLPSNDEDEKENDNTIITGGDDHDFLRVPGSEPEDEITDTIIIEPVDETEINTDKNLWQMLQTPTAWLMLWTATILVGSGIVITNNMGQMVEALGFPKETTSPTLAFYSVAQSGGRVITGALSESALNWNTRRFCIDNGIPRPFFLVLAAVAGFGAHLVLAVATSRGLFVVGATLSGLAFGMVWPLMVLIIGEVFGTANVGANYMFFDGFTSAAGSLLLSKFVAQEVYEDHIDRTEDPDNVTCMGSGCYSFTHGICAALSAVCIFTSLCMLKTTRKIYNQPKFHKG